MTTVQIVVLGAPKGKQRPRSNFKTGVVYTPQMTRTYEAALKYAAIEAMGDRPPFDGPLHCDFRIVVPIAPSWSKKKQFEARAGRLWPTKKPDFDNILKMYDALNLVVWIDDSQIVRGSFIKIYGDKPGIWVDVSPINEPEGIFA